MWIGLVNEREALTLLQKQIEIYLEKIGIQPEDRPFHPHLTLGRMKSSRGKEELVGRMEKHKEEEFGDFEVERVFGASVEHRLRRTPAGLRIVAKRVDLVNSEAELDGIAFLL